jgi:hypothetical protein
MIIKTDEQLANANLSGLQALYLDGTQVGDAGLKQTQKSLPGCRVTG